MFLKLDWESKHSDLPYSIGTMDDVCDTHDLAPGIYVVRDTDRCCSLNMKELGWQYLMSMLDMQVSLPYRHEEQVVGVEGMAVKHLSLSERCHIACGDECRHGFFDEAPCPNRLQRTLPAAVAQRLMSAWLDNSLKGRADHIGFIREDNEVAGFITLRSLGPLVEQVDLLAVRPGCRGKGYGKRLVQWAVENSFADVLRVRTELDNSAAIRCYEAAGFRPTRVDPLYWVRVEDGKSAPPE